MLEPNNNDEYITWKKMKAKDKNAKFSDAMKEAKKSYKK